jgi:hypothetical protein
MLHEDSGETPEEGGFEYQKDWDERLPLFLLAYRVSSHKIYRCGTHQHSVWEVSYICPMTCCVGLPPNRSNS